MDATSQTVVTIFVIAVVVWNVYVQIQARRQYDVRSDLSPDEALRRVSALFGGSWNRVRGPGDLNVSQKLRRHPPTLSVRAVPAGNGCDLQIWTSNWTTKYGVMAHAQLMWRKKRSVAALVAGTPAPTR